MVQIGRSCFRCGTRPRAAKRQCSLHSADGEVLYTYKMFTPTNEITCNGPILLRYSGKYELYNTRELDVISPYPSYVIN